jgi:hypothetical protein
MCSVASPGLPVTRLESLSTEPDGGGRSMALVQVTLAKGRTRDQLHALSGALTDEVEELLGRGGIDPRDPHRMRARALVRGRGDARGAPSPLTCARSGGPPPDICAGERSADRHHAGIRLGEELPAEGAALASPARVADPPQAARRSRMKKQFVHTVPARSAADAMPPRSAARRLARRRRLRRPGALAAILTPREATCSEPLQTRPDLLHLLRRHGRNKMTRPVGSAAATHLKWHY